MLCVTNQFGGNIQQSNASYEIWQKWPGASDKRRVFQWTPRTFIHEYNTREHMEGVKCEEGRYEWHQCLFI